MLKLSRLALNCLAVIALSSVAQAQAVHSVQGRVILPNGYSPSNPVRVTLTLNGVRLSEVFTDISGRFSFGSLRRGVYQLTAEGDGLTYESVTVDLEISTISTAPQVFTQNIQLRLRPGKQLPKADLLAVDEIDLKIPEQAKKEFEKGLKLAAGNKSEQASKHFVQAIEIYPSYCDAHVALAEEYGKLQRYDQSAATYQKAIDLNPNRADAHTGLGVILVKQKKHTQALVPLRRSIDLDGQSSTAYLFLGMAELMTGNYQSAESSLLRAYEIGKAVIAHIYLANVYELRGELAKAIERLQAFLKESPENPNARQIREAIEKLRKKMSNKK